MDHRATSTVSPTLSGGLNTTDSDSGADAAALGPSDEQPQDQVTDEGCSSAGAAGSSAGGLMFDSDRADFAAHLDNHGGRGLVEGAPRPRIVPGPDGRDALLFTLPGGGKRAAVRPRVAVNCEGDEVRIRSRRVRWSGGRSSAEAAGTETQGGRPGLALTVEVHACLGRRKPPASGRRRREAPATRWAPR